MRSKEGLSLTGKERRAKIVSILEKSVQPVSGTALAKQLGVSRQVVVTDMALLRAGDISILSTNKGYLLLKENETTRVFKVHHIQDQARQEMNLIVDCGGKLEDVFVYHRVYGVLRANLDIASRLDVEAYLKEIELGNSSLLLNVTSGYHYHTVSAKDQKTLDHIQTKLSQAGLLAQLQDYEPVDFWDEKE